MIGHNLFCAVNKVELLQILATNEHEGLNCVRSYDERFWKVFGANGAYVVYKL